MMIEAEKLSKSVKENKITMKVVRNVRNEEN